MIQKSGRKDARNGSGSGTVFRDPGHQKDREIKVFVTVGISVGEDRAFFPDETLYYPYCDCEDRSILFTRLVRDLLGFKCVLVYYPGHLASAVAIPGDVKGDYIMVNGKRFMVCDPTYIGASVGNTMPDMDNAQAKVILLD